MNEETIAYQKLNDGWKSACRVLFKEELGELEEYSDWLKEYSGFMGKRTSGISGKEVTLANDFYCKDARIISFGEKRKAAKPLDINQIKDIDSIAEAIAERWEYTGNKVLGSSTFVESSDLVMDSQFVSDSVNVQKSSYVFASNMPRWGKYYFGCNFIGKTQFAVHCSLIFESTRLFESHMVFESSDAYFCHDCFGCRDSMFSFFQRNKKNLIGNLELPKEKYVSLKDKILSEVAQDLRKNKRYPSLFSLVRGKMDLPKIKPVPKKHDQDMAEIEGAFSTTFSLILNKKPEGISKYEDWLEEHTIGINEIATPFGNKTYLPARMGKSLASLAPKDRYVSQDEWEQLSGLRLNEDEVSSLSAIKENLRKIGYFSAEILYGKYKNVIHSPLVYHASYVYRTYDATYGKYVGSSSLALNSDYIFGSHRVIGSKFCINCYNSQELTRCFELDASSNCLDSMFCHNCEGLNGALFCFNEKSLRNAVGNAQYPADQYKKFKSSLLEQVSSELEKKKSFKWNIYNIGCAKP